MSAPSQYIEIDHSFKALKQYLELVRKTSMIFVLVDSNTYEHCLPVIDSLLDEAEKKRIICIQAGELNKNIDQLYFILQHLTEQEAPRNSVMINLGGGMICDMGGFAASIFKRGIRYIHIPTTLLAQLDASIGGKNGIDFMGYKNLIGTITMPEKIFISKVFFKSLPEKEMKSGFAEAFKHGLIADKNYWNLIKTNPLAHLDQLLERSIAIKHEIVVADPNEKGIRKKLNAGHTIGHALEAWKLDEGKPITHGEAVAAGLIMESYISHQLGFLSEPELQEVEKTLLPIFGKIPLDDSANNDLLAKMRNDKKNDGGKISFSLIRKIGEASINDYVDEQAILDALVYYSQL